MALYIPHSIFHLARLLYVRPETFGPYYVSFTSCFSVKKVRANSFAPPPFRCSKLCNILNSLRVFPVPLTSCSAAILILSSISCCYSKRFMASALSIVLTVFVPKYFPHSVARIFSTRLSILKLFFRFRSIWCFTGRCEPLSNPTWKITYPYL